MGTKKITLNELRSLVKQIIKEEKNYAALSGEELYHELITNIKRLPPGINLEPIIFKNDDGTYRLRYNDNDFTELK